MTRISATRARAGAAPGASAALAEITRRAAHEVRNALNSVAVNLEVVRGRITQDQPDLVGIRIFVERAAQESDAAATLGTGLADLTRLVARGVGGVGTARVETGSDAATILSLPVGSGDDNTVSPDLQALGRKIGVEIKLDGTTVIFTVRN